MRIGYDPNKKYELGFESIGSEYHPDTIKKKQQIDAQKRNEIANGVGALLYKTKKGHKMGQYETIKEETTYDESESIPNKITSHEENTLIWQFQ